MTNSEEMMTALMAEREILIQKLEKMYLVLDEIYVADGESEEYNKGCDEMELVVAEHAVVAEQILHLLDEQEESAPMVN